LISFDGSPESSTASKLVVVKEHVAALMATIAKAKDKELAKERLEAAKANVHLVAKGKSYKNALPVMEECLMASSAPKMGAPKMRSMATSRRSAPSGPPRVEHAMAKNAIALRPAPPPAPSSSSATNSSQEPLERRVLEQPSTGYGSGANGLGANAVDYTQIPALLDSKCGALDKDNALRPTTIKTGQTWSKTYQRGLLSKPTSCSLGSAQQDEEKKKAFDLLDALSRSGVLSIESASLHVILAATHCFDKTMMDTIVQNNVNPIEPVERSLLIVAGVVHGKDTHDMLQPSQVDRIAQFAPQLLTDVGEPSEDRND